MRQMLVVFSLLLLLPAVAFAEGTKRTVAATLDSDGVQRAEIVGGSYFFDPYEVTVQVDTPVELTVRKEGRMVPHDLVIRAPEAGIDVAVELTTTPKIVRFTPTKTGSYPIVCSKKLLFLDSHQEKGMEGVLVVIE